MLLHDADKRIAKRWQVLPKKLGMPLNAVGFNLALGQIAHFLRFASFDATALGSTMPSEVYQKVIAKLRARTL